MNKLYNSDSGSGHNTILSLHLGRGMVSSVKMVSLVRMIRLVRMVKFSQNGKFIVRMVSLVRMVKFI